MVWSLWEAGEDDVLKVQESILLRCRSSSCSVAATQTPLPLTPGGCGTKSSLLAIYCMHSSYVIPPKSSQKRTVCLIRKVVVCAFQMLYIRITRGMQRHATSCGVDLKRRGGNYGHVADAQSRTWWALRIALPCVLAIRCPLRRTLA